jgi:rare lipoprotein A
MVLGEPFTVEGQLYTPVDTLNYDAVGYTALDQGGGITAAHRTLPLPSYVEVTSLTTGKTILARVERRGPMEGASLVALSPNAAAELGEGQGSPVRVRRVNPLESDRAELRSGRSAAPRIDTPKSLVEVLRRKLPAGGWASLRPSAAPGPVATAGARDSTASSNGKSVATSATTIAHAVGSAQNISRQVVKAYPLPSLAAVVSPKTEPVIVARAEPDADKSNPNQHEVPAPPATVASVGAGLVVQAGTFASSANAQRAAKAIGGFVSPLGKLFRVRTGPFASRGQAEAALAKVRAAGYSDARVYTAS